MVNSFISNHHTPPKKQLHAQNFASKNTLFNQHTSSSGRVGYTSVLILLLLHFHQH